MMTRGFCPHSPSSVTNSAVLTFDADILIVGSGFAGSLTALILNRIGLRPVLVDRTIHPRFAIGESATPTADLVLGDLAREYGLPALTPLTAYGMWCRTYPQINRGLKRGFGYFQHRSGEPFEPNGRHSNELLVTASSDEAHADTHWFRADVDQFLVEQVRAAGIPFLDETCLEQFDNGPHWTINGRRRDEPIRIAAEFLIDATGAAPLLKQILGLSNHGHRFRTASRAVFGHFRDVPHWSDWLGTHGGQVRDHPFGCDDAAVHHLLDGGWMWALRFDNGITSAGLVLDAAHHRFDPSVSAEAEWNQWLERYPSLAELFAGASLVSSPGVLCRTGRLQRRVDRAVGPNWALLPHAAGFIDPLHSTGIAHSLCGIERLMRLFAAHWKQPEFEPSLHNYEQTLFTEFDLIDDLISGCYTALVSGRSGTQENDPDAEGRRSRPVTPRIPDVAFRLFASYSMLYFAAATTYERQRIDSRGETFSAYLCADDKRFRQTVRDLASRISELHQTGRLDDTIAAEFERTVSNRIAPYNTAGLCDPSAGNMYRYTALPR